jgi:hypothetical protein
MDRKKRTARSPANSEIGIRRVGISNGMPAPKRPYNFPYTARGAQAEETQILLICLKMLEARVGIEPTHKGFADLSLTTWVPRLGVGYQLLPG